MSLERLNQNLMSFHASVDEFVGDLHAAVVNGVQCVMKRLYTLVDFQLPVRFQQFQTLPEVLDEVVYNQCDILAFGTPCSRLVRRMAASSLPSSVIVDIEICA
jgi:hypothetical protein